MNAPDASSRQRTGRIVALASVVWWIATIGGIMWVINANA